MSSVRCYLVFVSGGWNLKNVLLAASNMEHLRHMLIKTSSHLPEGSQGVKGSTQDPISSLLAAS